MHKLLITSLFAVLFLVFGIPTVLAQTESTPSSSTSTDSSSIRDKVREAIENLTNKPKAVLGSLEQISESTLQIKDEDGKLQQVATTSETKYARITKGKKADIKFTDLALGDFVTALGNKNGNEVLEAKRVIAYDEKPELGRQVVFGDITEAAKNILTVKQSKTNEVWTIETNKNTTFTKKIDGKMEEVEFVDLEIGDRIVAAGLLVEDEDNTISGGVVHVIPAQGQQKSSPTPSASPKVTPKASATPKPSTTPKPSPTATPGQ